MTTRKQILVLFAATLCLYISACSPDNPIELPDHLADLDNVTVFPEVDLSQEPEIELVRDVTYGDTDGQLIGSIGFIAVDQTGRVFMIDRQINSVHVFNTDGTFLRTIGREGSGPGEYRTLLNIAVTEDHLYIWDITLSKIDIISLETFNITETVLLDRGRLYGAIPTTSQTFITGFFVRNDEHFLLKFSDILFFTNETTRESHYLLLDRNGQLVDNDPLFSHKEPEFVMYDGPPLRGIYYTSVANPSPLFAKDRNDHLYYAWSDGILIREFDGDGNYLKAFYYPFINVPFNSTDYFSDNGAHNETEMTINAARNTDHPDIWPAIADQSFLVDDENRFWFATITDDPDTYTWWALENTGEMIGHFTWPRDQFVSEIRNGFLYSQETAGDGSQRVVRYIIDFPSGD